MTTLYGIAGCDTVKRARAWLSDHGQRVRFHDFKRDSVPHERLDAWLAAVGWDALLNRRGTTWRGVSDGERAAVVDAASARALMLRLPSVIKRPVVEWDDGTVTVGFDGAWSERIGGPGHQLDGGPSPGDSLPTSKRTAPQ